MIAGTGPGIDPVLACHSELAETVARMTELARGHRWQDLPALDSRCGRIVDRLRELAEAGVDSPDPERVAALVAGIRAGQEELERLLQPQFLHLLRRMGELQQPS